MKRLVMASVVAVFIIAAPLYANERVMTLNEFLYSLNSKDTDSDAYIKANLLAGHVLFDWQGQAHCAPKEVAIGQVTAMTKKRFENEPEIWHLDAAYAIATVLQEVWPCGKAAQPIGK